MLKECTVEPLLIIIVLVIIVAISVGIRYELYGTDHLWVVFQHYSSVITQFSCWLSYEAGFMWAFLGPMVVIWVVRSNLICNL